MEYEDLIEEESEPLAEKAEGEDALETVDPKAKSPWKAFILTGLLAGLIGALGGGAGIYAGLKTAAPDPIVQDPIIQETVDLSPLKADLKRLTARLKAAETKLQEAANQPAQTAEAVDVSDLESRLKALETAPSPEIDPDALTALQSARKDGFEWPDVSALETRIATLETQAETQTQTQTQTQIQTETPSGAVLPDDLIDRITALEDKAETAQSSSDDTEKFEGLMSDFEARLAALENRPAPQPIVNRVSILAFPKDSLIEALDESREGSLIEKTLSRHIRVKDENDPLTLIEGIETDLSGGHLAPAIEKFERLPDPVKSAGQAWYDSVKASL